MVPLEQAAGRLGARYSSADATPFDAFRTVDMHAFHGSPLSEEDRQLVLSNMEFDRTLAAFDGGTLIGTAGAFSFQLTVPGLQTLPAALVAEFGVDDFPAIAPSKDR